MRVKYLFSTGAILFLTLTFFALDTIADSESASDGHIGFFAIVGILLIFVGIVCVAIRSSGKERAFLRAHQDQLSSEDPKVLLELSEKCEEHLKDRNSRDVRDFAQQAKTKRAKILFQSNLETFKSEISEEGSHLAAVATLKEQMHNPDSFQHVSSDYEIVKKRGKQYHKVVMTFRGRNTFNALVLQTCYFLIDADNQVSLVGSRDDTESSPVNTPAIAASADAAAIAFEGVATLADLLSFFTSK